MTKLKSKYTMNDRLLYFILQQVLDNKQSVALERIKSTYKLMTPNNHYKATPTKLTAMYDGDIEGLELMYATDEMLENNKAWGTAIQFFSLFSDMTPIYKTIVDSDGKLVRVTFYDESDINNITSSSKIVLRTVMHLSTNNVFLTTEQNTQNYNLNVTDINKLKPRIQQLVIKYTEMRQQ